MLLWRAKVTALRIAMIVGVDSKTLFLAFVSETFILTENSLVS